jgi:hypothetical protein
MRPLKFRAWDGKTMFESFLLHQELNKAFIGPFDKKTIFLQFTGILDKNGKEIYEGDLIVYRTDTMKTKPRVIKWGSYVNGTGFNLSPLARGKKKARSGTYEVIGNVFQNKELLK